jgi:beta-N-acetylhexosaminidase
MALGPIMLDLKGLELLPEEREMLRHPLTGGVILFTRNYQSPEQIAQLIDAIHGLRQPRLLIGVDHEGGSVQRYRAGFTQLPACARLGHIHDAEHRKALKLAEEIGWLMAVELRAVGVDFSFAPVLDLGKGVSRVINDRAFHCDPKVIVPLARAYMRGMHGAGMQAVGKHFPGHGSVAADSHHEVPVDPRPYPEIQRQDIVPFSELIRSGLPAIMPAHVIYPEVDEHPAGFSRRWLRQILRGELGFQGAIFSDDICMAGAEVAGGFTDRARAALDAGCDMVLVCNRPEAARQVLVELEPYHDPVAQARLIHMRGKQAMGWEALRRDKRWMQVATLVNDLERDMELDLGDDALV